ncbi:hypothetical protein [Cryptosporangium minutisporangium]|uniref:Uncharacterized protein n=1 Tax=Cryptosporangium minutisporangium TaxID=113569 RepID=A0ABP6TDG3_9ACTN
MTGPFGEGRHRSAAFEDDDAPTARFLLDPDTEDETPTAQFVLNPYRGVLDYEDDDTPTARFVLNPYREPAALREAHDPFGGYLDGPDLYSPPRPGAVIEGEVVWRGETPEWRWDEPADAHRTHRSRHAEPFDAPPHLAVPPQGRAPSAVPTAEPRPAPSRVVVTGRTPAAAPDEDLVEVIAVVDAVALDDLQPDEAELAPAAAEFDQAQAAVHAAPTDAPGDEVASDDATSDDATADDEVPEPDEPELRELGPNTVGGAAERIVRELAPSEMTRFPVIMQRFFADEILQRRIVRWALSGARRDDPLALQLGGEKAELVTPLALSMLTCAATGVLGHVGTRHHNGVVRWRRNRRAASKRLSHGAATTLPHLGSIGTATVGQIVEEAAEEAGFTPDRARRLSILILSALTQPLR